jgi:hypothetical protein
MNNNILLSPVYASFSLSPYQTKLLFLHPFPVLTGGKYHKRKEGQDKSQHREILFLSWYIIRGSGVFGLLGSPHVVDSAIFPKESPAKAREIMRFSCVCVSMCIRSGRSYLSSLSLSPPPPHTHTIFFCVCIFSVIQIHSAYMCRHTHTNTNTKGGGLPASRCERAVRPNGEGLSDSVCLWRESGYLY